MSNAFICSVSNHGEAFSVSIVELPGVARKTFEVFLMLVYPMICTPDVIR